MKKRNNTEYTDSFQFVVNRQHVNKRKILLSSILFDKIDNSASQVALLYKDLLVENSKMYELSFIKNAFLDDQLIVQKNIQRIDSSKLELHVIVKKKNRNHQDIICKAVFWYQLKKAS